jgi:hypothetical protein
MELGCTSTVNDTTDLLSHHIIYNSELAIYTLSTAKVSALCTPTAGDAFIRHGELFALFVKTTGSHFIHMLNQIKVSPLIQINMEVFGN